MLRYRQKRARPLIREALEAEARHQALHGETQAARLAVTIRVDPSTRVHVEHDRESTVTSIEQRVVRMHHDCGWRTPRLLRSLIEEAIDAVA